MKRSGQSLTEKARSISRRSQVIVSAVSAILTVIGIVAVVGGRWAVAAAVALILVGSLPPLVLFTIARLKYHSAALTAFTAQALSARARQANGSVSVTETPNPHTRREAKKNESTRKVHAFSVDDEWGRRCREGYASKFETFVLQSRSVRARDGLAAAASDGTHDWASLTRLIRLAAAGYEEPLKAVTDLEPRYLRALARILVNQRSEPDDVYDGLTIYDALAKAHPSTSNGRLDNYLLLEAAVALENTAVFRHTLEAGRFELRDPFHAALMRANLLGDPEDPAWLESVNEPFLAAGVEPLQLRDGAGAPFDRVHAEAPRRETDDPLISVLVPTYEPDHRLFTAVRSLIAQTWQNIEIIIIDDCSSAAAREVIEKVAATDSRIRVIFQQENRGSYVARNAGLAVATGKYVTCHDDDDWSHPRKLELQATLLEQEDTFVATLSRHVRSSERLRFTRINVNPSVPQSNFSSLMFRRREVTERCGRWDEARKGADAEFKERLEAAFDLKVPTVGDAPMSLTRTRTDSLTAGEMVRGYLDPRRTAYMRGFQHWHASRPDDWSLGEPGQRPFHAPPGIDRVAPEPVDLVFATDFRFPGGTSALTLSEIFASLDAGYRVGVLQMESPLNSYTAPMVDGYWDAIERGAVMLTLPDAGEAELTIVRHPSVLQFADRQPQSGLSTRQLVLVVNHLPVMRDGRGAVFDVAEAAHNASRMFQTQPAITPESGVTRKALESVINPSRISDQSWPGFVGDEWFGEPRAPQRHKAVVGRHGRDHWIKWPALPQTTLNVYDHPDLFETRVLGGVGSVAKKLPAETLARWRVYEFNEISPREFVNDLDFWVFFHHKDSRESFGMAIAEAMASGAVVILPPYLESTFGEGALYCQPKHVSEVIAQYWADAGAYFMQSKRAIETARELFSRESFLRRVRSHLSAD